MGESQGGAYLPPELQDTMTEALRTYPSASLIMDLGWLTFLDSEGIRALIGSWQHTPAAQRPHDHQPSEPIVRGVLTIIGLLTSSAYHIGNRLTGRAIASRQSPARRDPPSHTPWPQPTASGCRGCSGTLVTMIAVPPSIARCGASRIGVRLGVVTGDVVSGQPADRWVSSEG